MIISLESSKAFKSYYAQELDEYLSLRKLELSESGSIREEQFLRRLDTYICNHTKERMALTNEFWQEWISRKSYEKANTQAKRVNTTKKVISFLQKRRVQAESLRIELSHTQSDYVPYIFSDQEILAIFRAADNYKSTSASPFLHLSVPITFRILYGCGLRVSELLHLKLEDVDMQSRTLYIENSKFNKSRYVPFSTSLATHIEQYIKARHNSSNSDSIFISKSENRPYNSAAVHYWLMNILYDAGIHHHGKGYGPRVHDFRHTFAVHSLRRFVMHGEDITSVLPVLSAYLGHKDLRGTQSYLRLTTELYPYVISALVKKYGNLIEGGKYNAD